VKVLDFGLAKAMDPPGSSSMDAMHSPTLSVHATTQGVILGTAAYMAPEQAGGKAVDRRADVWAFGVVLYEMLTGTRAFAGDDITITLASVLKDEVRWHALPADVPAPIRRLLTVVHPRHQCARGDGTGGDRGRHGTVLLVRRTVDRVLGRGRPAFSSHYPQTRQGGKAWAATRGNNHRAIYKRASDGSGDEQQVWTLDKHTHLRERHGSGHTETNCHVLCWAEVHLS